MSPSNRAYGWPAAILLLLAMVIGIAPTLPWLEFASGSENLNAATVLEMHRDGHWLVPTLNNQPRLAKPPLTAWMTAAAVSHGSLAQIDAADQAERDTAYARFAFQLRWPALALACGLVLSVYWLGRTMESPRSGFAAAVICASTVLLLRFARNSSTDIQLGCWVALANAAFAAVILGSIRVWKLGLISVALGLAILSKGPVALAQTCAPWLLFALLDSETRSQLIKRPARWIGSSLLVFAVALAISVPWFAYVAISNSTVISLWWAEVTREGATTLERDPWFAYVTIFMVMIPWTGFFIAGLGTAIANRNVRAIRLTLCLLIVPIVIMSFAKDKTDRYLVPILPAASLITALAVRQQFRAFADQNSGDRILRAIHWTTVAALMIGVPVLGVAGVLKTVDGDAWFAPLTGTWLIASVMILLAGMLYWSARSPGAIAGATLVCMLVTSAVGVAGYRNAGGRSELKPIADLIRSASTDSSIWFYDPPDHAKPSPADLSIYLNRPVRTIVDDAMIALADDRTVLVMLQRKGRPDPTVAGWTPIGKRGVAGRYWWALRREHASNKATP